VDGTVLAKIIDASAVGKDEVVCEAGTGRGILTQELCKRAKRVISYEVDKMLYTRSLADLNFSNLELVNADLFKRDERFDVFVSNLPYSKSRDAFEWLALRRFNRAILMVQKEFANKLTAEPGNHNYKAISIIASYCFHIEPLFDVGKECFHPRPLVESTVIRVTPRGVVVSRDLMRRIHELFSRRNKRASTVAARLGTVMDFGDKRVDQLAPSEVVKLACNLE
jgi:16S rRNA (adenine1518-N6/adenine1519-N6)-dimethyltransferase